MSRHFFAKKLGAPIDIILGSPNIRNSNRAPSGRCHRPEFNANWRPKPGSAGLAKRLAPARVWQAGKDSSSADVMPQAHGLVSSPRCCWEAGRTRRPPRPGKWDGAGDVHRQEHQEAVMGFSPGISMPLSMDPGIGSMQAVIEADIDRRLDDLKAQFLRERATELLLTDVAGLLDEAEDREDVLRALQSATTSMEIFQAQTRFNELLKREAATVARRDWANGTSYAAMKFCAEQGL